MARLLDDIKKHVNTAVEASGYHLYGCELHGDKRKTLHVYIDRDGGVTAEDCATASKQISIQSAISMPMIREFLLEVSSPGLDRSLYEPKHYQSCIDKKISVKTKPNLDGRKHYKGYLKQANNTQICIEIEGQSFNLAYDDIERGKLIYED